MKKFNIFKASREWAHQTELLRFTREDMVWVQRKKMALAIERLMRKAYAAGEQAQFEARQDKNDNRNGSAVG